MSTETSVLVTTQQHTDHADKIALLMHRLNTVKSGNNWFAFKLAALFASIWCFWIFLILSLAPLAFPSYLNVIQFVSSGVLQLIALPLLAYTSDQGTRVTTVLMQETHDVLIEYLKEMREKQDAIHATIISQ
jgi:hypothetical protein